MWESTSKKNTKIETKLIIKAFKKTNNVRFIKVLTLIRRNCDKCNELYFFKCKLCPPFKVTASHLINENPKISGS